MATPREPFDVRAPGRVLVVVAIMLDRYTWGHADRVSPVAPVLVMRAESCEVRLREEKVSGTVLPRRWCVEQPN
jgi:hypothetical protein